MFLERGSANFTPWAGSPQCVLGRKSFGKEGFFCFLVCFSGKTWVNKTEPYWLLSVDLSGRQVSPSFLVEGAQVCSLASLEEGWAGCRSVFFRESPDTSFFFFSM